MYAADPPLSETRRARARRRAVRTLHALRPPPLRLSLEPQRLALDELVCALTSSAHLVGHCANPRVGSVGCDHGAGVVIAMPAPASTVPYAVAFWDSRHGLLGAGTCPGAIY